MVGRDQDGGQMKVRLICGIQSAVRKMRDQVKCGIRSRHAESSQVPVTGRLGDQAKCGSQHFPHLARCVSAEKHRYDYFGPRCLRLAAARILSRRAPVTSSSSGRRSEQDRGLPSRSIWIQVLVGTHRRWHASRTSGRQARQAPANSASARIPCFPHESSAHPWRCVLLPHFQPHFRTALAPSPPALLPSPLELLPHSALASSPPHCSSFTSKA